MKLASLKNGRDGRLVVVSKDLTRATDAFPVVATLQAALDNWAHYAPRLQDLAQSLEIGAVPTFRFHESECAAPLPRAYQWLDGSAYVNHVDLARKARGATLPESFWHDPLMYQGGSDTFMGARDAILLPREEDGIDFEAEIVLILNDTPMGVTPKTALDHIALVMLTNDVSLRHVIADELVKGLGFVQGKPASSFSPVALSLEEFGEAWAEGKLHFPLLSTLNDEPFGKPNTGEDMVFNFATLIAHAAKTRKLSAGTLLGGGTVSNKNATPLPQGGVGFSCITEIRMWETLTHGKPQTEFMQWGDKIRIEMKDKKGHSLFGAIEQLVKKA